MLIDNNEKTPLTLASFSKDRFVSNFGEASRLTFVGFANIPSFYPSVDLITGEIKNEEKTEKNK